MVAARFASILSPLSGLTFGAAAVVGQLQRPLFTDTAATFFIHNPTNIVLYRGGEMLRTKAVLLELLQTFAQSLQPPPLDGVNVHL